MKDSLQNMKKVMKDTKDRKYLKTFLLLALLILLAKIVFDFGAFTGTFNFIMGLIQPFFLGFIVAYCINIPVAWCEKRMIKIMYKGAVPDKGRFKYKLVRPLCIVVNLVLLVGFIVFGLMTIVPMLYNNVRQLIDEIPGYITSALNAVNNLPFADELGIEEMLADFDMDDIWDFLPEIGAGQVAGWAGSLFSGVFTGFLTIVATLYFLAEYNHVKDFIKRLIRAHSPKRQKPVLKYIRLIDFSFRKFISCQFLDSLVLATITMIAFTISGSPYAVTLALMLGVLNVIPYFGSIVGTAVAVFIIWASSGLQMAIIMAIVLFAIQQFDGNFINPKIMGTSFKISPVLVIIAITIGGAIGGVLGMIFAVPVANVIKNVLEEYIQTKEELRKKLGETSDDTIKGEVKTT
jgi:predicted PurR-regulated permease PerM